VAGGDLNVAYVNSGVEHGGHVCRSMCRCMRGSRTPAVVARRRSHRVAAWRSMLAPRVLSRIGPSARAS
jgi:hypothetical protein